MMCCLGNKNIFTEIDINSIRNLHQIINKFIDYLLKQKLIKANEVDTFVNQVF